MIWALERAMRQFRQSCNVRGNIKRAGLEAGILRTQIVGRICAKIALAILKQLPAEQRAGVVDDLLSHPVIANTPHGPIRFLNHSRVTCARALSILSKEPDSLKWIDAMLPGSLFWDIGANVGVLTLYAATRGDLRVWAFEPAAVNYYNLVANCELNGLERQVRCLQLGFGESFGIADLNVSQLMGGHSFSFKKKVRHGQRLHTSLQAVELWSIDDFIARHNAPCPNYIKIDVPGLTRDILAGATRTLARPELREIQVEVREQGSGGRYVTELMARHRFKILRRGMKRGGKIQGDLVFARDEAVQPSDGGRSGTSPDMESDT
jgi:FkbM family methyltransferase